MPNVQPQTERGNTAREMLAGWAVTIDRDLIERHDNNEDFGALLAFAAVLAWRDRGPGWGDSEGTRNAASTPPGGWPALAGCTAPTWRAWRDRAIDLDLLKYRNGKVKGRRPVKLLGTSYRKEAGKQFARLPIGVICDPQLSRTARRCYAALALYRNVKDGETSWSRVAVVTIGCVAGLDRRNTQRALRELVKAGALVGTGDARTTKPRKYLLPADCKTKSSKRPSPEGDCKTESSNRPKVKVLTAPGCKKQPPQGESSNRPINESLQESIQESISRRARGDSPHEGDPIARADPKKLSQLSPAVLTRRRREEEVDLQQEGDGEPPPLKLRAFGLASAPKTRAWAGWSVDDLAACRTEVHENGCGRIAMWRGHGIERLS